ncbi:MAG: glycosyltransferase family 9 protein [Planctomycetota bacterium]
MSDPGRILLVRPSALGDVCRTVPVLVSLRERYPSARIDWLVQDTFVDAIVHHPALDGVVAFPRAALGRTSRRGNLLPSIRWMNEHLRPRGGYDLVVDAQGLFRSGLFTWWTRAGRRIGDANARESAGVFYTERHAVAPDLHTVDRMLRLLEMGGIEPVRDMRLHADPRETAWVDEHLGNACAVLAPTSRWAAKQWPDERFTEVARELLGRGLAERVVLVGGPGERAQTRALCALAKLDERVTDLIGETSIARLMAIVSRARLVVANDSATLHMGVGFDRPCVALYGPTDVDLVGPYARETDVIQHLRPGDTLDHKDARQVSLMQRISPVEVLAACEERLLPRA